MPPTDLDERTFHFACDAYDFCQDLWRDSAICRHIAYQLFRSASSIGANRAEAKFAYSRREFALKNSIALKECREVVFWLRLAEAKALGNHSRRERLMKESTELVAVLATVLKQLQAGQISTG